MTPITMPYSMIRRQRNRMADIAAEIGSFPVRAGVISLLMALSKTNGGIRLIRDEADETTNSKM